MRFIDRRLCSLDTAPHARSPLRASLQFAMGPSSNCIWSRPPMPAKLVVGFRHPAAHRRQRRWRERQRFRRREGRVPRQPGDGKIVFDSLVKRLQLLVTQRPVVRYPIQCAYAKIRGHVPLPMRCINYRAASHGVVEHCGNIRIRIFDRVIRSRLSPVRIARPIAASGEFEIRMLRPRL